VIGFAALEVVHVNAVSLCDARVPIGVVWRFARARQCRGHELLEKMIECFAERREGCDEDADREFGAGPDGEVYAIPRRILRLGDGLEFDSLED
jgi:hypothetical protein